MSDIEVFENGRYVAIKDSIPGESSGAPGCKEEDETMTEADEQQSDIPGSKINTVELSHIDAEEEEEDDDVDIYDADGFPEGWRYQSPPFPFADEFGNILPGITFPYQTESPPPPPPPPPGSSPTAYLAFPPAGLGPAWTPTKTNNNHGQRHDQSLNSPSRIAGDPESTVRMLSGRLQQRCAQMHLLSSPFSQAVVAAMRKLYPEALADKSFDNTGLLLEAPFDSSKKLENKAMLTIDLSAAAAQEAIDHKCSVVVTYHPIIFRGLKSLTMANSQQRSLLRLAAEGISVYSPHTAVDAAVGGNGDWLADIITGKISGNASGNGPFQTEVDGANILDGAYNLLKFPSLPQEGAIEKLALGHHRRAIKPCADPQYPGAGTGRFVTYENPQPLVKILEVLTAYFGRPAFSLALPSGVTVADIEIRSVGICAGSGSSVIGGPDAADLLLTGEMSHHEALEAVESGRTVVTLNHSNSERGYLSAVMRPKLESELMGAWQRVRQEFLDNFHSEQNSPLRKMLEDTTAVVKLSGADKDPFDTAVPV